MNIKVKKKKMDHQQPKFWYRCVSDSVRSYHRVSYHVSTKNWITAPTTPQNVLFYQYRDLRNGVSNTLVFSGKCSEVIGNMTRLLISRPIQLYFVHLPGYLTDSCNFGKCKILPKIYSGYDFLPEKEKFLTAEYPALSIATRAVMSLPVV